MNYPDASVAILAAAVFGFSAPVARAESGDPSRGEIVFAAGNCTSCHTDLKNKGPLLAGGRGLATPFGVFFGPNITP
ncbi:MAG: cytochrome C, partial [Pseudomonadota bacterium]